MLCSRNSRTGCSRQVSSPTSSRSADSTGMLSAPRCWPRAGRASSKGSSSSAKPLEKVEDAERRRTATGGANPVLSDPSRAPSAARDSSLAISALLNRSFSRTDWSSSIAAVKRSMKRFEYLTSTSTLSVNSAAMLRKCSALSSSRSAPPGAATKWPSRLTWSAQSAASQAQLPRFTSGHSRSSSSAAKKWYSRQPMRTKTIWRTGSPSSPRSLPERRGTSVSALRHILRTAAGQMRQ
mmetsp:Transcript_108047/g.287675  ORF Transcript_108047/g.287675 Transcript_108047/m.287675 type:complete len:238 (+) Transcript_108047:241-954(+)